MNKKYYYGIEGIDFFTDTEIEDAFKHTFKKNLNYFNFFLNKT